ncbi:MAG: DUF4465 domain-containing protein [Chitinophagaceae bacterium]|jgi:hypothetical protein
MRKFLLSSLIVLAGFSSKAQTVADFETPVLPKSDTAYINYSNYGKDVGFSSGLAYFPCVYDTSFGFEFWSSGFAYSNMRDSVTSGFMNSYSAKPAIGFAGSAQYVVANGVQNTVRLTGAAMGASVNGFYVTNSTYAFNSMRDGDGFAKKFNHSDSDFFRLDIFAYSKGAMSKDSVSFYLADFRNTDSTKNYIVRDWNWVDLLKLGKADSLLFRLQSSDNGSFGMNTPGFFCMDNLITNETNVSVKDLSVKADIRMYPNPASNVLFIESNLNEKQIVSINDITGKLIAQYEFQNEKLEINVSSLASGTYILNFRNGSQVTSSQFVKQ